MPVDLIPTILAQKLNRGRPRMMVLPKMPQTAQRVYQGRDSYCSMPCCINPSEHPASLCGIDHSLPSGYNPSIFPWRPPYAEGEGWQTVTNRHQRRHLRRQREQRQMRYQQEQREEQDAEFR
jgi:hypothetical protein